MLTKLYVKGSILLDQLRKDERGVTAIEYAIVAVAIAGAVGVAFAGDASSGLTKAINDAFLKVTEAIGNIST